MKFSEFLDVRDGTHDSPKRVNIGKKLITTKNLEDNRIDFTNAKNISLNDFKRINERSKVDQFDILLSMIGTVGNVYQERSAFPDYAIKNLALLKFHGDELLSNWMNYYLQSKKGQSKIHQRLSGSTQQYISLTDLRNIEITLPNRDQMELCIKPLRYLDDLILKNNQINDNLDALLTNIFKKYMINDDFEKSNLTQIANYKNGLAMQKYRPNSNEESLPVLKIKELNQGNTDDSSDRCSANLDNSVIVNTGDIIFSWSGTLLVKNWTGDKVGLNQHLFKVTSNKYPAWFIYEWTKYHLLRFQAIAAGKATTMGHIKRSDLKSSPVYIPSQLFLEKMDSQLAPIYSQRLNLIKENQQLSKLKQTLLNKYF
ncbi:restriction endonuclease subunit S [Limosilactobacillus reuteri]|uniref:restriction endonuclease subunit S n=1 Tax=Limosilactobacillus reuteri TaxID=1598 RepID=UPI003990E2C1